MDDARPPLNKISVLAFSIASLGAAIVIGIAFGALSVIPIDPKVLAIIFILSSISALILGILAFIQAHRHGQSGFLFALIAVLYGLAGVALTVIVLFFLGDVKSFL